jgi:orotate phosphoribosyltransferase
LLEAALAIREAGAEPILLVAVVDRGGTAEAMAAAEGLAFRAILTAPDLGFDYEGA